MVWLASLTKGRWEAPIAFINDRIVVYRAGMPHDEQQGPINATLSGNKQSKV